MTANFNLTVFALPAWPLSGIFLGAISRPCQQPCYRSLTDSPRPCKQIGMAQPVVRDCILKRINDMWLADNRIKTGTAVLSVQRLLAQTLPPLSITSI